MVEMVGASFILIMGLMTALWLIYFFQRNATIVDLGWTASFLIASWVYLFLGSGYLPRRIVMTAMVTFWAGRLLLHLWKRFDKGREDPRYTALRERMGDESPEFKFFLMFLFQGFIALVLTLPFLLAANNGSAEWSRYEGWGFIVWMVGVAGETLADRQLADFRRNPQNRGEVCRTGLWFWSRHPNYFFEFVVWIGFALFAFPATFGLLAFLSPAIMYCLLVHVSGIPLAEAQALKTKGEAYREYQKKTSVFFPWFPN